MFSACAGEESWARSWKPVLPLVRWPVCHKWAMWSQAKLSICCPQHHGRPSLGTKPGLEQIAGPPRTPSVYALWLQAMGGLPYHPKYQDMYSHRRHLEACECKVICVWTTHWGNLLWISQWVNKRKGGIDYFFILIFGCKCLRLLRVCGCVFRVGIEPSVLV